jgi:hypothetical protein
MTIVALTHGYPPLWNMGGEVALQRLLEALPGRKVVLTKTHSEYVLNGVEVKNIDAVNVLDINTEPNPIANQLSQLNATIVIGQNELSLAAVKASKQIGAISIVNVHTPPKYGKGIAKAVADSDYCIYNTRASAIEWGEPDALVVHPPITKLPDTTNNNGDAYTLLSSLVNKGIEVVLQLAQMMPDKRFIVVRSPAEPTHGLSELEDRAALLQNLELHPRLPPESVYKYFEQTRILLAPSRYETYGMSAIEAAGYGIPSVHVDTPHVREGIGDAAILVSPLDLHATLKGIRKIEADYNKFAKVARARAEWLQDRQVKELEDLRNYFANLQLPISKMHRKHAILHATKRFRLF